MSRSLLRDINRADRASGSFSLTLRLWIQHEKMASNLASTMVFYSEYNEVITCRISCARYVFDDVAYGAGSYSYVFVSGPLRLAALDGPASLSSLSVTTSSCCPSTDTLSGAGPGMEPARKVSSAWASESAVSRDCYLQMGTFILGRGRKMKNAHH